MEVIDEGGYWDSRDKTLLIEKISFLKDKMDIIEGMLSSLDREEFQQYSPNELVKLIEEKLKKGLNKNWGLFHIDIGFELFTIKLGCPGATQTGYITPENEEWIIKKTPLGRLGYSEDMADVITFLASEQGRWLTGQLIYASGGFLKFMSE